MDWTALGVILAFFVALFGLLGWLWNLVSKGREDARLQQNESKNDYHTCMGEIDKLRNEVYREYMPLEKFDTRADRLAEQISALSDKLDTKVDGLRTDLEAKIDRLREDRRTQRT